MRKFIVIYKTLKETRPKKKRDKKEKKMQPKQGITNEDYNRSWKL